MAVVVGAGENGDSGTNTTGSTISGGAAGNAIDGILYVTITGEVNIRRAANKLTFNNDHEVAVCC